MPAVSVAQRRLMGMCEHADHPPASCPNMTHQQFHDFASTSEKDLPERSPVRVSKRQKEDLLNGFRKR